MLGSSDEDFEGGTQAPLWDESDEESAAVQLCAHSPLRLRLRLRRRLLLPPLLLLPPPLLVLVLLLLLLLIARTARQSHRVRAQAADRRRLAGGEVQHRQQPVPRRLRPAAGEEHCWKAQQEGHSDQEPFGLFTPRGDRGGLELRHTAPPHREQQDLDPPSERFGPSPPQPAPRDGGHVCAQERAELRSRGRHLHHHLS